LVQIKEDRPLLEGGAGQGDGLFAALEVATVRLLNAA
jgi:hypothetical protein